MTAQSETVIGKFNIDGSPVSMEPYGSGHINDTFLVTTDNGGRYILQRINHNVFTRPDELMENISRVTTHLRAKITADNGNPDRECLTLVTADDGKEYVQLDGNWWRTYLFVENTESFDKAEKPEHVYRAGKAFGRFQAYLADLPGQPLHETIPAFHSLPGRLAAFEQSMADDTASRATAVTADIAFVHEHADAMSAIHRQADMPVRITHNDTKLNNVLLHTNGDGGCVIDLDTVMNGYVHFDYGDALRTVTSTGAEDEADTAKVSMNPELFRSFTKGYLEYADAFLSPLERETLPLAGPMMSFMIGLRFLTDYLDGDTYFKIKFPEHNLVRARAQFALVKSMLAQMDIIKAAIPVS